MYILFIFVFYTSSSVESSEYIENALYFSILQINYSHSQDLLYIIFHLGPKTANRISIFSSDIVLICLSVCCTVIQIVSLLFIFLWWEYWKYSLGKCIFPKRTVRSFNLDDFLLHRQLFLLCNLCNRLYIYFWKYNTISIEVLGLCCSSCINFGFYNITLSNPKLVFVKWI